jgi:hypothetical protein
MEMHPSALGPLPPLRPRLAPLAILTLLFGIQLPGHVFHELNRTLGGPGAAEVRRLAGSLTGRMLTAELGPEGKVSVPASWMARRAGRRSPPASLLVFVDGRRVPHFIGDPARPSAEPYAYYRSRRASALFVRCPEGQGCAEALVAVADARLAVALLRSRLGRLPGHAWAVASGLLLWTVAAAWATWRLSPRGAWIVTAAALLVLASWVGFRLQSTSGSLPLLVLEACALGTVLLLRLRRPLRDGLAAAWTAAASPRTDTRARLARAGFLAAASCAVAVPYVVTGVSWYPADKDDSFLYLRGASRLLADGSLLEGMTRREAWVYSIYPLGLAALSQLAAVHPMVAYRWLGYAGAALLPAAMGLFAYAATKSLRTALLACGIAGLWGGLAGYVWLAREAVPAILHQRPPPLLNDDYFEPRFLGEYAGPHSELTAYVCRVPLYPREAGLLLFWPALGLVYGGLPRPGTRRILGFAALVVATTAVYPYYGIPGLLVLAGISLPAAFHGGRLDLRRLGFALTVCVAAGLVVVALADLLVRLHKGPDGLFAYLVALWGRPPERPAILSPVKFTLARVVGGHFFMAAAMFLAWRAAGPERTRRLRAWKGWTLFLPCAALACLAGVLARFEVPGRFLDPYGWIVPWRTLVEPVMVLGAAVAVGALADHLRRSRRFYLAAPLLLAPVFSPMHWTVNADLYLREEAERAWGRGRNRALYEEYARLGTAWLGKLKLREPVLVEARYVGPLEAALGVRALGAVAHYEPLVLYSELQGVLDKKRATGEIGDVAALRGGAFERRMAASSAAAAALGPYTILRWAPPAAAP